MKKLIFFILFLSIISTLSAQKDLDKAKAFFTQGDYKNAVISAQKIIKKEALTSQAYFDASDIISNSYYYEFKINELEIFSLSNYKKYLNAFGKNDTTLCQALSSLCDVSYAYAEYDKGIEYLKEIKAILKYNNLTTDESYAACNNNLGLFYTELANYKQSEIYLDSSLTFFKQNEELYSLNIIAIQVNLGNLYQSLYDYAKARNAYLDMIEIETKYNLEGDENLFNGYLGYSTLEKELANEPHSMELIEIAEKIALAFEDEKMLSSVYNNKGLLYKSKGDYKMAESFLLKNLDIKVANYGNTHPYYITAFNNLASLYTDMNNLEKAEEIFLEIIRITEQFPDLYSNKISTYYNNLANLYSEEVNYELAYKYFKKALDAEDKIYGIKNSPFYLVNNIANSLLNSKRFQEAENLYAVYQPKQTTEIENILDLAYYYNNLAEIELQKGNYDKAITLVNTAESTILTQYNDNCIHIFDVRLKKGLILKKANRLEEAAQTLDVLCSHYLDFVEINLLALTEHEKNLFTKKIQNYLYLYFEVVTLLNPSNTIYNEKMFNYRLRTKSIVLRYGENLFKTVIESDNKELQQLSTELMASRKTYSYLINLSKKELKNLDIDLEQVEKTHQNLEKRFIVFASEYLNIPTPKNFIDLQKELKTDEALVEIVKIYNLYEGKEIEEFYVGLIVKKNQKAPIIVPITKKETENKWVNFYLNMVFNHKKDVYSYKIFWKPLEPFLSTIKTIKYSPDGVYHKININTLYDGEKDEYLFNRYLISQSLTLDSYRIDSIGEIKKVALFGNPNFYLDLEVIFKEIEHHQAPTTRSVNTAFHSWSELPGTKKEVELISKELDNRKIIHLDFTEQNALENNFKTLEAIDIIHLATHGYYEYSTDSLKEYQSRKFTEPMLHNGLVLSGGGATSDGYVFDKNSKNYEDGLLNALEVSLMDLSKTKLVVLSACNSGVGEIRNEEGVFGLQRGFAIAGVEYVLASLWEVDDLATQEFMVEFYKNLFQYKSYQLAYNKTMETMRLKYKDIYYWGAFNLIKL